MRKSCCHKQQDLKLTNHPRAHGQGRCKSISRAEGLRRCGKSCRLKWVDHMKPNHLKRRRQFGEDEEDLILKLHALLGNRWSLIAGRLPGRTDAEVKNHWNTHMRRKLVRMGIDPNNHKVVQWKHEEVGTRQLPPWNNYRSMAVEANQELENDVNDVTNSLEDDATSLPDLNVGRGANTSDPSSQVVNRAGMKKATPITLSLFT